MLLRPVHRWAGLGSMIFVTLAAITGLVIQWDAEIEKLVLDRAVWSVEGRCTDCPLGRSFDRLVSAVGGNVDRIEVSEPDVPGTAVAGLVTASSRGGSAIDRHYAIDPAGRTIKPVEDDAATVIAAIYEFHHNLLLGLAGTVIMWAVSIALILLPSIGLVLWWPMTRRLRGEFRTKRGLRGRMWLFDRHRIFGLYMVVPILVIASSAFLLTLLELWPVPPATTPAAVQIVEHAAQAAGRSRTPGELAEAVAAIYPDGRLTYIAFDPGNHDLEVGIKRPWDIRPVRITLDSRSGQVREITLPATTIGRWLIEAAVSLHSGAILGLPGRLLNMAAAGTILFVSWTGLLHWWKRRRPRRPTPRAAAATVGR